ncbi:hypothetical protein CBR_g31011 [Chara braunii]|uniref:Uncharacterized protein n=1 Tax=Chara braunii TaxID=69332 RepID=A0A388LE20_CHABU|nr:hypothetical protein CBR_g31011 [Chara braunii]|eukprot:GBG80551.1 hypothetical protein CBR_g31011 [Chara braunii]
MCRCCSNQNLSAIARTLLCIFTQTSPTAHLDDFWKTLTPALSAPSPTTGATSMVPDGTNGADSAVSVPGPTFPMAPPFLPGVCLSAQSTILEDACEASSGLLPDVLLCCVVGAGATLKDAGLLLVPTSAALIPAGGADGILSRKCEATESSASSGQSVNQSMVMHVTSEGQRRILSVNWGPIGLTQRTIRRRVRTTRKGVALPEWKREIKFQLGRLQHLERDCRRRDDQRSRRRRHPSTTPEERLGSAFLRAPLHLLVGLADKLHPWYCSAIAEAEIALALIEAEEQRQLAAEAARLQAEAAATAEKQRLQAEADADTQARLKEAQVLLQRHETASSERLKFWHFEPNGDDATPEEQHKEFLSKLSHEDATRALNSRVLDLEQAVPGPDVGESSSAPSNRQLEQRVDHVVAMLDNISTFAAPTTISNQLDTLKTEFQQLQSTNTDGNNPKQYKMPTFQLDKFDDYTHQDPVLWWEAFTTQLRILPVAKHAYIGTLFMNSNGGCQIWLTHLPATHGVDVADLKDKVSWEELTRLWKKRFIVDDAPALAINRLFTMTQGNTATRDWLTEWQKIAATPDLDLPFSHLRREFYNRSCAALSQALGDREQYATFAEIIDKAREIIKTKRAAAHKRSTWQPTYVEKVRTGPRQQQFAPVQSNNTVEGPTATQASREGDQVAAVQPRSNNKPRVNGKAKSASQAGNGQPAPPWVKFGLTEAEYKYRSRYGCCYWCNSTKHKTSLCQDQAKEDVRPRLILGN